MHELLGSWDGEFVVTRHDRPTGAVLTVAVHTSRPQAGTGGTRMRTYPSPDDAVRDALRLSEGMTYKFAVLDLPLGGAKAVLDVPADLTPAARKGLLERYGDLIESLRGAFQTGHDMGTTTRDMDVIAGRTAHVFGTSGGAGDPGPFTALGVFSGIRASVAHRLGRDGLGGLRVLVQGLGGVGTPLAARLRDAGAEVLVTDLAADARGRCEAEGHAWVDPDAAYGTPCDVFAPCAVGGILDASTIAKLGCSVVAGSANNQLATPGDAERLRARGILYAPDVLISGGGAFYLLGAEALGWSRDEIEDRIRGLGDRLLAIYRRSEDEDVSTHEAALRVARAQRAAWGP